MLSLLYDFLFFISTAWKVSVFRNSVVRIQSKCGKIQTITTPNTDTFHTVHFNQIAGYTFFSTGTHCFLTYWLVININCFLLCLVYSFLFIIAKYQLCITWLKTLFFQSKMLTCRMIWPLEGWSFQLKISSVNVTKFTGNCGFVHIY